MKRIKFVGLDVHADTIAVAEQGGNTVPGERFRIARSRFGSWSRTGAGGAVAVLLRWCR